MRYTCLGSTKEVVHDSDIVTVVQGKTVHQIQSEIVH